MIKCSNLTLTYIICQKIRTLKFRTRNNRTRNIRTFFCLISDNFGQNFGRFSDNIFFDLFWFSWKQNYSQFQADFFCHLQTLCILRYRIIAPPPPDGSFFMLLYVCTFYGLYVLRFILFIHFICVLYVLCTFIKNHFFFFR